MTIRRCIRRLTAAQLAKMGENGDGAVNSTPHAPALHRNRAENTTVIVTRVLSSLEIPDVPETETIISNPRFS
jgi:hypothetical protein